jgi:hypothetical protein
VYTSKRQGARTYGAVYVTLHGSQGLPITSAPASSSTSQRQQLQQQDKEACPSAAAAAAGWRSSGRHELHGGRAGALEEGSVANCVLPSMRCLGQLRQLTLELESATVRDPES